MQQLGKEGEAQVGRQVLTRYGKAAPTHLVRARVRVRVSNQGKGKWVWVWVWACAPVVRVRVRARVRQLCSSAALQLSPC